MIYSKSIIACIYSCRNLIIAFILMFSYSHSQINTLCNSYTLSNQVSSGMHPISFVYGNSLYIALKETNGVTITKMNFDGVPIQKRTFTVDFSPQEINALNGYLFISGINAVGFTHSNPFLLKIDTANFNIDFIREYPVANFSRSTVQKTKFLSNGNILMVGAVSNSFNPSGPTPRYGLFLGINSNDGSVIYTSTLNVNNSTSNFMYSFTEISNSSIIFVGSNQEGGFIGRAIKTANSLSVNSTYWIDYGLIASIESTSNPKKLALIAYGNCLNAVFKIDTALNLISGTSPGLNLGVSFGEKTFYNKDKIYYSSSANYLSIYDTSLTFITSNSYPFISGLNTSYHINNIALNNTNIFTFFSDQVSYSNFYLLKTNLNGQMNCSVHHTNNSTPLNLYSIPKTFTSGLQPVGSNTLSSATSSGSVLYSTICSNVDVKLNSINQSAFEIYPNPANDSYTIILNEYYNDDVFNISITNSIGEIVQVNEQTFNNHKIIVSTDNLPQGVYLVTLKNNNGIAMCKRLIIRK